MLSYTFVGLLIMIIIGRDLDQRYFVVSWLIYFRCLSRPHGVSPPCGARHAVPPQDHTSSLAYQLKINGSLI